MTSKQQRYIVRGTDHAQDEPDTISRPEVFDTQTGKSVSSWPLNDWDRAENFAAELNAIDAPEEHLEAEQVELWELLTKPLVATVANMEACKDVHGVIMLDVYGNEWSASAGDYFHMAPDEVFETDGLPNILVCRRSYLVHPLSGGLVE